MTDIVFPPRGPAAWRDRLPTRADNMALFLDLDGTLIDIAATPDAVVVPGDLIADLEAASKVLDGALAIVSGRDLASIDSLLAPLHLPVAAEHGAVIRLPDGTREEVASHVPEAWIDELFTLQHGCPGVIIERKTHSVVAHFRKAPLEEERIRRVVEDLVTRDSENFETLAGKMVIEIRPRHVHKGGAVHRFMPIQPFCGKQPVFIGDDVTDEDGFRAATELGGMGLHVAVSFDGQPSHVRRWLKQLAHS